MSTTIDEKVVEMRFDNRQFEKNVQTSLSTIDRLKQKLNLTGAAKGLENINVAAKNCNMNPLVNAVETVRLKFSALEVMAITALSNITNSALNAGKRIVSALTIDPVKTGFQEYETQINAVQTILANTQSKGTTIDQVNDALDELNKYADQTIYNFTEMTRNIGTFTAAGVDLDKSVTSIKGIANLAAVSGSTSQQASTAMYQLSQALAAGKVQLMDWNSVVNAGMGGELFQNALKRTAEHFGYNVDEMIAKYGSFRESLTQGGWLTAEVLTETLTQLSGAYSEADLIAQGYTEDQAKEIAELAQTALDAATKVKTFTQLWDTLKEAVQSGWTQSWEIVIGDFEEAKALLTSVSETFGEYINASADARNSMLQGWKDLGGRTVLIESFRNAFEGLLSIVRPLKEAFRDIFPRMTSQRLYELTEGLRNLTENFKISDETADKLKRTFRGVFALFDIGWQGVKTLASVFSDLIGYFAPVRSGALSITAGIGDFIVKVDNAIKSSNLFGKSIKAIGNFLEPVANGVKTFVTTIKNAFGSFSDIDTSGLDQFTDRVKSRFEPFTILGQSIQKAFEIISTIIGKITPLFKKIGSIAGDAFGNLGSALLEAFNTGNFNSILDLLNSGLFAAILVAVRKFFNSFSDIVSSGSGILKSVTGILDGVKGSLEAWQSSIKAGTILKIASAMAILTGSIAVLSMLDPQKLSSALGAMSVLFVELIGSLTIFEKVVSGPGFSGIGKITIAMIGLSTSILILSSAVKSMASLDWGGLIKGLTGVGVLATVMVASTNALSKTSGRVIRGSLGLVVFASAIRVLAGAVSELSKLNIGELTTGLIGVGVLCTELALFLKISNFDKIGVLKGTGLLILASALNVLASAVKKFASLDIGGIVKGLSAVGVLLLELAVFTKLASGSKNMISIATGMTILGTAILIFGEAIEKIGSLSLSQIAKGLLTMAGSLAAITVALNFMPKGMLSKATGMIGIATALTVLGNSLSKMGGMSWSEIAKSLITLAGSLTVLVVALNSMNKAVRGAAALVVVSAALAVFTPIIKALGNMSWGNIVRGLAALAGSFAAIGVAGAVLGPMIPAILGLSGAIALLGVGCLAAGAGILALSTGLTALAVSGVAGAGALVTMFSSLLSLIPLFFTKLGEGIIAFAGVIKNGSSAILDAFTVLILAAVDAMRASVPAVVDGLFYLIDVLLSALEKNVPKITEQIFNILIGILEAIANRLPELIKAGVNVLMAFFSGVIDAIGALDFETVAKGIAGVGLLSAMMLALSYVSALIPGALVGVLGMGVVIAELAALLAVIGGLAQIPGLNWIIGEGGNLLESIGTAIGKFVGGIAGGLLSGISSQFAQIGTDLSNFMINLEPFIYGAKQLDASSLEGVKSLVGIITALTATNILDGITSWFTGGSTLTKFAEEIIPFGKAISEFSNIVSDNIDSNAVTTASNAGKMIAEMAKTIPNSGGVIGFFAGNNDLDKFSERLIPFGKSMAEFSSIVSGNIDEAAVTAAANAGKTMSEMTETLPNSGGLIEFFTGGNDMDKFAKKLIPFGKSMAEFSNAISGKIDEAAVTAAANAGKTMSEMEKTIPDSGGIIEFFTGGNDMDKFAKRLIPFGEAMTKFSKTVSGNIDESAVTAAANAGRTMAEMAETLPDSGGLIEFFTGGNDMDKFAEKLIPFGEAMVSFSNTVSGNIDSGAITAAANAGKMLSEMQKTLPNTGGVISFFSGDQDLTSFSEDIVLFGDAIAEFSEAVGGRISEDSVIAAANAGKAMAEMQATLPNSGGVVSFFAGDQDLAAFSENLVPFGKAIAEFSSAVSGQIDAGAITAAANAGRTMAEMEATLPETGGVFDFFTGAPEDMGTFSKKLVPFGRAMVAFSNVVSGKIDVGAVTAAANAGNTMAQMQATLPETGGVFDFFTGAPEDMTSFADKLVPFGEAMVRFSDTISGNIDSGAITAAANAGSTMAKMQENLEETGGVIDFFVGRKDLGDFGENLAAFGVGLKSYSESIDGINAEQLTSISDSANSLVTLQSTLLENGIANYDDVSIANFGNQLTMLGEDLLTYYNSVSGIGTETLSSVITQVNRLVNMANNMAGVDANSMSSFGDALMALGESSLDGFISAFDGAPDLVISQITEMLDSIVKTIDNKKPDCQTKMESLIIGMITAIKFKYSYFVTEGKNIIDKFVSGFTGKTSALNREWIKVLDSSIGIIKAHYSDFYYAAEYLVRGFANGISANTYRAQAQARAMASAAARAAAITLDEHSPSKVGYRIGDYFGIAFVNAISDNVSNAYEAGSNVANSARDGLQNTLSKIRNLVSGDLDFQPTIRPVLDLSNIQNGASQISGLFSQRSVALASANTGIISNGISMQNLIDEAIKSTIKQIPKDGNSSLDRTYQLEVPVYLHGREIARSSAVYMQSELDRLSKNNSRKGGIV